MPRSVPDVYRSTRRRRSAWARARIAPPLAIGALPREREQPIEDSEKLRAGGAYETRYEITRGYDARREIVRP